MADCEADQLREEVARLAQQVLDLNKELSVYKPTLLSLAFLFICIALWLAILLTTGKRRDKIRRLMRREKFANEAADVESTEADKDSVLSLGQNENETSKDRAVPPTVVFEPPVEEGQQKEEARVPKMSLPARMSDLYQSYPDDAEEMTTVPDIVFTRASSIASGVRTPRRGSLNP